MGGEEWGVGRGGEGRSTWAPPLETGSGSAPADAVAEKTLEYDDSILKTGTV